MEVDEILAAVDRGANGHTSHDYDDSAARARDLQALTRAWVNEKGAPEVLPWPEDVMRRTLRRIREQIEVVEDQASVPDPKTSFNLIIIETELERFKFLVRSLLRTRIAKIDRFALHYLNNASARARLSPSEAEYAATHQAMLAAHYQASFLGQFPLSLQRLDDTAGGIAMVEQPDADKAVFVRALVDSGIPVQVPGTDIEFILARGSVYVVRWSAVRDRVEGGEMELI